MTITSSPFNYNNNSIQLQLWWSHNYINSIKFIGQFNYNITSPRLQYIPSSITIPLHFNYNISIKWRTAPVPFKYKTYHHTIDDTNSPILCHHHYLNHPHGIWPQYLTLITTSISYNTLGQLSVTIRSAAWPALCMVHTNVVQVFQVTLRYNH